MIYTAELDHGETISLFTANDNLASCIEKVNNLLLARNICKSVIFSVWRDGVFLKNAYVSADRTELGNITYAEIEEQLMKK